MRVDFLDGAIEDLEEIADFIALDNPVRAVSFIEEIRQKCHDLSYFPESFPILQGFAPFRKRSYKGYIIVYRINETSIDIILIFNSVRDYSRLLKKRPPP